MNNSFSSPENAAISVGYRFARALAWVSLAAPLAAVCVGIVVSMSPLPLYVAFRMPGDAARFATDAFLEIAPPLLILLGLIAGIVALLLTRRFGNEGVIKKAIIGICTNGLLLAVFVGVLAVLALHVANMPATTRGSFNQAIVEPNNAPADKQKFYALGDAAKECLAIGRIKRARQYAKNLLKLAPRFRGNWNYGNAIQNGNLVLGRIAVREGHIKEADRYLLAAAKSPGSPQMDSFGPNMSLAKDLLEKGQRNTVLQYFALCHKFWKMDSGKLDRWAAEVRAGDIPHFGANLLY